MLSHGAESGKIGRLVRCRAKLRTAVGPGESPCPCESVQQQDGRALQH